MVMTEALHGLRILDFSHVFQGPVGTQLLGDFGADVIKIERPGSGDWSRRWGPYVRGVSMPFVSLNRNKRSITLDLKHPRGMEVLLKLADTADVLVHNYRPGVMERLGLSYEELSARNPGLIYAKSSGWGDEGPYVERGRGGHDMMARAAAGLFAPVGPDDLPVSAGISADYPAGMLLTMGILMAVISRQETGRGQIVSTDLFSAAFHTNTWSAASRLNEGHIESAGTVGGTEEALRNSYRTADGYIEISPVFAVNALRDLSQAMRLGDLSEDERFHTPQLQIENADTLNAIIAERFLVRETDDWVETLESAGVLCTRINTYAEAADDAQLQANGMVEEMAHPQAGSLRVLGTPIRMSGTPGTRRELPPELGQHNRKVLQELGYSVDEAEEVIASGAMGQVQVRRGRSQHE